MTEINTSELLLARLAEGLDSTAKMTQALLSDLRDSEADFAAMKTELNILKENVKGLSEVIRDGGTSSILTRVALIEQSLDNIRKWMDNHVDVHQRMKKDFTEFRNLISEIERRLSSAEDTISEIEQEKKEHEKEIKTKNEREMDLVHEQKKNDDKLRSERRSEVTKLIVAVVIVVVSAITGYLANSCQTNTASKVSSQSSQQVLQVQAGPSPSSAPSRNP